jgi:hypothetical protein
MKRNLDSPARVRHSSSLLKEEVLAKQLRYPSPEQAPALYLWQNAQKVRLRPQKSEIQIQYKDTVVMHFALSIADEQGIKKAFQEIKKRGIGPVNS